MVIRYERFRRYQNGMQSGLWCIFTNWRQPKMTTRLDEENQAKLDCAFRDDKSHIQKLSDNQ